MLQPSVIPTAVSSELTESLQQTLSANRLRTLKALGVSIPLPTTVRQFVLFLLAISLICGAMTFQILLSIQIWQMTAKVERLKTEYRTIEQQNTALVWDIAQKSSLENVQQRAFTLGYSVALKRYYVAAPQTELAVVRQTAASAPTAMQQPLQVALRVDTAALNVAPEVGFFNKLQKVGHTFEQWWQAQWQKLLRKP